MEYWSSRHFKAFSKAIRSSQFLITTSEADSELRLRLKSKLSLDQELEAVEAVLETAKGGAADFAVVRGCCRRRLVEEAIVSRRMRARKR